MKKFLIVVLAAIMMLATAIPAMAQSSDQQAMDPELLEIYQAEMSQAKYIINRYTAYEHESFLNYYQTAFKVFLAVELGGVPITEETIGMIDDVAAAREQLVQIVDDPEDVCIYIWGDEMATEPGIDTDAEYWMGCYDNPDFKPFLIANIHEDQADVKGNIIFVSGGGYLLRSNMEEAYPCADYFYEHGYNTYVLQRRVVPYDMNDSSLDLQRAIRYLRYHAEELGIASNVENMAAAGYSGGAGTVGRMLEQYADDQTPDTVYADYTPDEIDQMDANLDAILLIYGGGSIDLENLASGRETFPATFLAFGTDDMDDIVNGSIALYQSLRGKVSNLELHGFSQTAHGFGLGQGIDGWMYDIAGTDTWADQAITFLDVEFGYQERNTGSIENYPEW